MIPPFLSKQTVATFVDAWQVADINCNNEIRNDEGLELTCTDEIKSAGEEVCRKLLNNEKFGNCLEVRQ